MFDSIRYGYISNQNFTADSKQFKIFESAHANFLNVIFSKMRRQKYFFDFRFEISVKFRVEWCIRLYDSYLICQYSLYFVYIHAYANTNSRESVGKFEMNHIVLYIIRREILRWSRIWSQKNIFAYAF